jgi:hypothetical protein
MSRAGAGQIHERRAGSATQLETLRDEVRQGQQAIIERLARIEARQDQRSDLKPKNSGGAPEKFDWFSFAIEVLRLEFDDEILSRAQLRRHMENWIATHWPDGGPSERILRARLAIICKVLNLA